MKLFKKGQGLSLNVIIVAAIALILLVLLVLIFTGRINIFKSGIEKAGATELATLKISYGDCHPSSSKESAFRTGITNAKTSTAKDKEIGILKSEISSCKAYSTKSACEGAGCGWK